ncbi:MAG: WecB/TagA/CpsF family glycosyltransferase [Oscillochloridaceae bacterium umkhey_bin13]
MRKLLVILGVPVDNLTMEEALARCDEFIALGRALGKTHQIATVNADFVVNSLHDPELQRILQEADMATADGMPLVWGSRLLGGSLPGRVTGADLVPALAERAAHKGYSIYFLGAREGIAAKAAAILQQRNPGLKVAGVYSPPPASVLEMDRAVMEQVRAAKPDILLVAFGNPKQEKWIRMYAPELQVPIAIGIGGTLDMIVGVTKRAPRWMQQTGLEWVYRLAQEPRRLLRRYLHDFGYFGYFFVQQWWAMRKGTAINMVPPAVSEAPPAPPPEPVATQPPTSPPPDRATLQVLRLSGRIDVTNYQVFANQARDALAQDPYLALSLAEVQFLDSTALGALVGLANQARDAGGALYLIDVPKPMQELLALVRLDRFFEILADQASAERRREAGGPSPEPEPATSGWSVVRAPRIFDTGTAPQMIERCASRLREQPYLVIDLAETAFLASAGMAALLQLDKLARSSQGSLRIAGGTPDVIRTLKLVKLDTILALFPSVSEAAASPVPTPTSLRGDNALSVPK